MRRGCWPRLSRSDRATILGREIDDEVLQLSIVCGAMRRLDSTLELRDAEQIVTVASGKNVDGLLTTLGESGKTLLARAILFAHR
jgi:hypothetical protein